MGLTTNGFKRKTHDELVKDMSAKAKELYGADANTTEKSMLGIIIRVVSWFLALLWQDVEDVYHSAYRKSAEGVQLDKLLPYAGINRNLADYAYTTIQINGTPNHLVESGFLVSTNSDIVFETIEDVTLDITGAGSVEVVAQEIGKIGKVEANAITQIVNTDANVTSVNNSTAASGGNEKETDTEARSRSEITIDGLGSATTNAIRANILKLSAVRAARVIENDTEVIDTFGTPAHAVQAFVLGGTDIEIAQAIFEKKSGGIQAFGTTYVLVLDDSGETKQIGFTRATEVRVYVKVTVITNSTFQQQQIEQLVNELVKYVGGTDHSCIL